MLRTNHLSKYQIAQKGLVKSVYRRCRDVDLPGFKSWEFDRLMDQGGFCIGNIWQFCLVQSLYFSKGQGNSSEPFRQMLPLSESELVIHTVQAVQAPVNMQIKHLIESHVPAHGFARSSTFGEGQTNLHLSKTMPCEGHFEEQENI